MTRFTRKIENKNHIPKGSMCAVCTHKIRICAHLDFNSMSVMKEHDHYVVVCCEEFEKIK